MSVTFDAMLILELRDRDGIADLNRRLYAADTERHQQFGEIDMDKGGAGGTKSFTTSVYAATFNHFGPDEVEEQVKATNWRYPHLVYYLYDLGDYRYEEDASISFRSVAQLRAES